MKEILKNVDFVDAIKKGNEISMKIFLGSLHVCEKGIHFYFCPQYARNKIKIPHKQHVYKGLVKNTRTRSGNQELNPIKIGIKYNTLIFRT